ncbi:unnamed protein product, partial [Scytosiphon promiscuus]
QQALLLFERRASVLLLERPRSDRVSHRRFWSAALLPRLAIGQDQRRLQARRRDCASDCGLHSLPSVRHGDSDPRNLQAPARLAPSPPR